MKFTGEFFVPHDEVNEESNLELEIEHKQRYLSILNLVEGKTVLDIASGEGYGSHILSSKAKQVTGVDINPELVTHANQKYGRKNLGFLDGSVEKIPLDANSIDVIVSFETFEHVEADIQALFLKEAKRVLRPDGVFIVSTPNKKNYTDRYNHQNKFHLHEVYEQEFEEALKGSFGYVQLYDQGLEVSSIILNKDHYLSQKPLMIVPVNNAYHFEGKYLIAVCSNHSQSVQTPIASVVPKSEKTYFQMIDRILSLQKEVEELGSWGTRSAAEVEDLLKQRGALIEEKGALIEERGGLTNSLEAARRETESLSNEKTDLINDLELAHQSVRHREKMIEKMQRDLAQSNHEKFLIEAEVEAVRAVNAKRNFRDPDVATLTDSIDNLASTLSKREVNGNGSYKAMAAPVQSNRSPEIKASPSDESLQQIAKLQEHIEWYKKTYEERSFLGVIKQKIALKFRK